jgi:RNA polymerase sigma-32 factor
VTYSPEHMQKLNDQAILAQQGDAEAKTWLIKALHKMCRKVVYKVDDGITGHTDDLMQEASIALLHAIRTFDPAFNVNFYSHALTWATGAVKAYMRQNKRTIRLPESKNVLKAYRHVCMLPDIERNMIMKHPKHAAKHLGIHENDVKLAIGYLSTHEMSTATCIAKRSERSEDEITLGDSLEDARTPETLLELDQQTQFTQHTIERLVDCLNDKERIVVKRRLLAEDPLESPTLMELGAEIGVSGERIRQLEGIAMKKMRAVSVSLAA